MSQYIYSIYISIPGTILAGLLWGYIHKTPLEHLWKLMIIVFPLAVFGTATHILRHRLYINTLPYPRSEDNYQIHQMRIINMNLPIHQVDELCVESLKRIKRCKVNMKTRYSKRIVAYSGWDCFYVGIFDKHLVHVTYGEKITFDIIKIEDNVTQVIIKSRPKQPIWYIMVDFGKNLRNVEAILDYLEHKNPRPSKSTAI